jgi:hypothetical protein
MFCTLELFVLKVFCAETGHIKLLLKGLDMTALKIKSVYNLVIDSSRSLSDISQVLIHRVLIN